MSAIVAALSLTVSLLSVTDKEMSVQVKMVNDNVPVSFPMRVTVQYQRWGFDETVVSDPIEVKVNHPITVKQIDLGLPGDWLILNPADPRTLLDQEAWTLTLNAVKVTVKL